MHALLDRIFTIVDVETTGSSPIGDRIIEIGMLRIENGQVVKTFSTLVNPRTHVPPSIERITGIAAHELLPAPTFEDIAHEVRDMLDGAIFVAHNARFDYGFVKNELKRAGFGLNAKCVCTVRLSRKMFKEHKHHDLSSIIERFGFVCEHRHRALDDAQVLWDFITHIDTVGRGEEMAEAIQLLLKEHTLPQFLDEKTVRALPETPGVYMFYGPDDEVLYVGKSLNIRGRVLSHFSNDHATTKEMHLCQETRRVEALETPGELSALLLESKLVKSLSPLYNRQLRRRSELVAVQKSQHNGYITTTLLRTGSLLPRSYGNTLGIFRTVRQAKDFLRQAALEHMLCPKLLGLEKGKGGCFAHQIGRCGGACVLKESSEEYNKRLLQVFKKRRIRSWPFAGPIMIEEKKNDEEKQIFIVDNWCLIADIKVSEFDTEEHFTHPQFDYDAYKILLRYMKNPLHKKRIKRLSNREYHKLVSHEERVVEFDPSL